jgi:hypothetical protein
MTYYPVGEPVAVIVNTVTAHMKKRVAAKEADDARKAARMFRKASDRNAAADIPAPRPVVASMRQFLGMAEMPTMRQALGLA